MEGEGEGGLPKEIPGEGREKSHLDFVEEEIQEKILTFEEASRCLNMLGKDESGMRYAYLMLTAVDKKLTDAKVILNFKHVMFVDVSGNYLDNDALQVFEDMPFLVLLKADRNRLGLVTLAPVLYLQELSLNRNVITETSGIAHPLLEVLSLHYNQIYRVEFVEDDLLNLLQLELRGNYLPNIGGFYPPTIENLYLAENRIQKFVIDDMQRLTNLKILHLRDNQIQKLNGFAPEMANLHYLNIRKNKINKMRQFRKLQCLPKLETIVFLQNPVRGDMEEEKEMAGEAQAEEVGEEEEKIDPTRIALLVLLPALKRINKGLVTLEERKIAERVAKEKLEEIMNEESSEEEWDWPASDYTNEMDKSQYENESEENLFRKHNEVLLPTPADNTDTTDND